MNTKNIIIELKKKFPGKVIIQNKNEKGKTTEIVCEVSSSPKESFAVAVIDISRIHYHKKITETYKVVKGELKVFKYFRDLKEYKEVVVKKGERIVIKPGEIHTNIGDETWVEVTSRPAWRIDDYFGIEDVLKKFINR